MKTLRKTPTPAATHWRIFGTLVTLVLLYGGLNAQVVDLPLSHEAYDFMDRMESKGYLTGYRDALRPLPRKFLAEQLLRLHPSQNQMTRYEIEEYTFLLQEFNQELQTLRPDSLAKIDRWRPASFDIAGGRMNIGLNVLLETRRDGVQKLDKRTLGFQTFGSAFGRMGYYFNYTQTNEKGELVNSGKQHTAEQGVPYFGLPQQYGFEYNVSQAGISYDFGALSVSIEQTMSAWGDERYGNIILSTKPPSYPKVKLRASLTDWMNFTFIHAELHSNILDSARSYEAGTSTQRRFLRTVYRSKFLAAHVLQISPWNMFDLTFGESVVYSDRGPLLLYLIPLTFFKSGEHYNRDTDNTQIFASLDVPLRNGITLTGSFFVDEISVVDLFDPVKVRNQIGLSAGARLYDLPINNVELFMEYTRLNPWVYSHKYAAATFTNNGFVLGHWIGQNADLSTVELIYRPTRSVRVALQYQSYRKGDTSDVANQYGPPAEDFLYGRMRSDCSVTLSASYQFVTDAFLEFEYRNGTIDDQQRSVPTVTTVREFALRLRYGLW